MDRERILDDAPAAATHAAAPQRATTDTTPLAYGYDAMTLQRTAGNGAVSRAVSGGVSTADDVLLEPMPVSPPQVRVLGDYTEEQISLELYGIATVPINYLSHDSVEVHYSTLLPRWRPAFRLTASDWEKTGAEERQRVGHEVDGKIVWTEQNRWQPIPDPRRGGLVVAYGRSSGGYTEIRNTNGELVFVNEIGIESVRFPIIDDIGDALKSVGYAAVGVVDAWLEDNWAALGLPPHERPFASLLGIPPDSVAYRIGRGGGHLLALLQAAAEMVGGAAIVAAGGGEMLVAVATTPAGGAGLVVMPVAVVTVAAGTAVVVHGGALAGAVFMNATGGGGGGGGGGGKKRGEWKITKEGTAESRRHGRFGRFDKSKSDGLWWSRDQDGHGGSKWKVFKEESDGLHWVRDADEFGDFIVGKHKGPTGQFIPWSELIPVR